MPGFWGSNKEDDIEFKPEEFKKDIETAVTGKVSELENKLNPVLKFINDQREALQRAEEERTRQEEARRNAPPESNDFIIDPQAATRRMMQPLAEGQMRLSARLVKEDTLRDEEYYTGTIKEKVDAILAQQPLANQSDPSIVKNTYKIVCYDHQKEIAEGKIKSRASAVQFSSNGTGGHGSETEIDKSDTMTDEEKMYARKLGLSEKDWIASRKELIYVN